ncbi:type IV secretion system protein [Eoetvoesiella caeni]|uniref:Type IV secretion system protein VirB6 n=1 Tax=Eoetvoesiella caeni TaxID=645616 RepID=A0A366H0I5_9BURK|nr:type IV secretion system protein [Eoetvoesiella caeni]MCI2811015.1 type IV secretion system protein [Eoetvoesiella caeni]NYT56915.1 type IV secretion system protein [Eoetvoesiella caeni]RBP35239.1 type IV secretion system protein VirB6 [Eoetvoesiella caeni]
MSNLTPTVTPPSAPSDIAQWVMTQTENVLNDAVNGPMQTLFEALMPVIVVGLTLQFVVYAFALMHGQSNMTVTEFFRKAILVAIISMIFGVGGLYQNDIAKAMVALPDDVTELAIGTGNVAHEVDKLQSETSETSNTMLGAGGGDSMLGFLPSTQEVLVSILATLVRINAAVLGSIIMVIIVVCKVGMALIVAAGPIFIAATLFEPTKPLFNSWISQALNFVFLALLAGLIFGLLLQINIQLIRMIAGQINAGDQDIMSLFGAQTLVGIASLVIMVMIPGLAAGLSNGFGAQLGVGTAAKGAFSILRLRSMLRLRAK